MTNDNQDALRCAEYLDGLADEIDHTHFTDDVRGSAAHLRRLVRENEDLKADRDSWADQAAQRLKDWDQMRRMNERQSALLRQAVEALEQAKHNTTHGQIAWNCKEVIAAIRLHLEGRA